MNTKKSIILAFIFIAAFGFWFFFHKKIESKTSFVAANSQNQPDKTIFKNPQPASTVSQAPQALNTSVAPAVSAPNAVMEYIQKIKADPQYDWKQPISFYGLVVDESNAVVVDANVHFEWNDLSEKGTSDANTTSDSNGGFSLTDRRGKYLFITVSKDGYYSSGNAKGSGYEYANPADGLFTPDPNRPVVFHLRKKGEGAKLIHGVQFFGFRTNGTMQYLDLLQTKNTLAPPGDLAVQLTRGARNSAARFDWSVTISVPDGGLMETNEEFMFEAPADGYQPSIAIQMTTNDLHWTAGAKMQFYFKSRNGSVYGRAEATVYPQYQKAAAIDLDYYVNPSGSRNLEPK